MDGEVNMKRLTRLSQSFEDEIKKRIQRESFFYEKVIGLLERLEANITKEQKEPSNHSIGMLNLITKDFKCAQSLSLGVLRKSSVQELGFINHLRAYDGKIRLTPLLKETSNSYYFGFEYKLPTVTLKEHLNSDLKISIPFLFNINEESNGEIIVTSSHTVDFLMTIGSFAHKNFKMSLSSPNFDEDFKEYVLNFVEGYIANNAESVFGIF